MTANTIGLGEYTTEDLAQEIFNRKGKVTRIEVIDESGRAYVAGGLFALGVTAQLSFQDDCKTLKVFVEGKK